VVACASKKSPECSMAVELEFGMMFECSMLGVIGEEMALQRSSAKMLFQFLFMFSSRVFRGFLVCVWNVYRSQISAARLSTSSSENGKQSTAGGGDGCVGRT
jgi:hypothetical protein